jgi:hypothetical protein
MTRNSHDPPMTAAHASKTQNLMAGAPHDDSGGPGPGISGRTTALFGIDMSVNITA